MRRALDVLRADNPDRSRQVAIHKRVPNCIYISEKNKHCKYNATGEYLGLSYCGRHARMNGYTPPPPLF